MMETTVKEKVLKAIEELPADATYEDAFYQYPRYITFSDVDYARLLPYRYFAYCDTSEATDEVIAYCVE